VREVFDAVTDRCGQVREEIRSHREYVASENPSGDRQAEADVQADRRLVDAISGLDKVGQVVSEERDEPVDCGSGELSVAIDPLDGSSNIKTNNVVGTIVGVYSEKLPCEAENLESAFYIVYGPTTTAVRMDNEGNVSEHLVEAGNSSGLEIPSEPQVYGLGGNKCWGDGFRELESGFSERMKLRYCGGMVGDVNQVLHRGGLFGYPDVEGYPDGKLRAFYEAIPVGAIVEAAGGRASDGNRSITEQGFNDIHTRTPFFAGNTQIVEEVEAAQW
jgi:fructose-1,6-bisphosphatase I